MKAYVTVGISASGKSFWAESQKGFVNINRDNVRRDILEARLRRTLVPGELWRHWKFGKDEKIVNDLIYDELCRCAHNDLDLIVSDTNLNKKFRDELISKLVAFGYDVEIKEFPITLEDAWKRDAQRADGVGHSVLHKQWQQWNEYIGRKVYEKKFDKPLAVICDVDGTVAHMNGNRGAFEWDKVILDKVDPVVRSVVNGFYRDQIQVIILSGRDGICKEDTEQWFKMNGVCYHYFWMRKEGDMRKDTVIKEEIFWEHIADNFNVIAAIDDRPVVCRLWMDLGIKVLNVGNPYQEF